MSVIRQVAGHACADEQAPQQGRMVRARMQDARRRMGQPAIHDLQGLLDLQRSGMDAGTRHEPEETKERDPAFADTASAFERLTQPAYRFAPLRQIEVGGVDQNVGVGKPHKPRRSRCARA